MLSNPAQIPLGRVPVGVGEAPEGGGSTQLGMHVLGEWCRLDGVDIGHNALKFHRGRRQHRKVLRVRRITPGISRRQAGQFELEFLNSGRALREVGCRTRGSRLAAGDWRPEE